MFGIGSTELLVILVVALIVLGPKTLASLSKTVGKAVGEFRRVSTDFQRTLNAEAAQEEYEERKRTEKPADAASPAAATAQPAGTAQPAAGPTAQATTGTAAQPAGAQPAQAAQPAPAAPPAGSPLAQAVSQAAQEAAPRHAEAPRSGAQA